MSGHIVKSYENELAALDRSIGQMGGLAEQLLGRAFEALEQRNPELADRAVASDDAIDELQAQLEEQVVVMIARRQPMANDLRQIMAVLKVAGDLERIGDLAKNIAKRAVTIASVSHPKPLILGLRNMYELAAHSLKDALDAYAARDDRKAVEIWHEDQRIDALYNSLFRELLTYMMEDPRNIGICTHLLFVAKNLERIGDHTTNIAETIHFLTRGYALAQERPKHDKTSSTLIQKSS
ncbi:MAG TPA: phosphate signaling complex protein PhoU [Hyphomicrobium sp.]|nr:phosphate signaling complex protein PhoU [Hyphomicrobium sp.]